MNYNEYGNEVNTEVDYCQNSDKKLIIKMYLK